MTTPSLHPLAGLGFNAEELDALELELKKPRKDPLAGTPVESVHHIFNDGRTVAGVWECTPGRFIVKKEGVHSIMYFLSGRATITDATGQRHEVGAGSVFMEPDGWVGEWEVHETVRKIYVIAQP
jgi:uncharacterized cupin superfamily protein